MSSTLPTPRSHLTSLLTTLFTPKPPPPNLASNPLPPSTSTINPSYSSLQPERQNPLKSLTPNQKALLTTLHVLFPPPMLLQALDLIDRGLVICYVVGGEDKVGSEEGEITNEIKAEKGKEKEYMQPSTTTKPSLPPLSQSNTSAPRKQHIYQVHSSMHATTTSLNRNTPRFPSHANLQTTIYIVHLEAWNCSCAAFAFGAFPYFSSTSSNLLKKPWSYDSVFREDKSVERKREEERNWEFGGLSLDGNGEGDGVPVCKHLLACLLVERWDVLGSWVERRRVGRDEGAGLGIGG